MVGGVYKELHQESLWQILNTIVSYVIQISKNAKSILLRYWLIYV